MLNSILKLFVTVYLALNSPLKLDLRKNATSPTVVPARTLFDIADTAFENDRASDFREPVTLASTRMRFQTTRRATQATTTRTLFDIADTDFENARPSEFRQPVTRATTWEQFQTTRRTIRPTTTHSPKIAPKPTLPSWLKYLTRKTYVLSTTTEQTTTKESRWVTSFQDTIQDDAPQDAGSGFEWDVQTVTKPRPKTLLKSDAGFFNLSTWGEASAQVRVGCPHRCGRGYKCMINTCVKDIKCPKWLKFGDGPPSQCEPVTDPNNTPPTALEEWFTRDVFNDLFPKANIGWGPGECSPYNYDSFIIAARYYPRFGTEHFPNGFTAEENFKRDLSTFFAHAIQETGENDASLYGENYVKDDADACFYRGGFFNWFEGGPKSIFMPQENPGFTPEAGKNCISAGRYCIVGGEFDYFFKCNSEKDPSSEDLYEGCYFGRGAIQISYNYNYGQFQDWLASVGIYVDLLADPNLVMTKRDPPLAVLASMWFYMTPQPPKPAMHDIVLGNWEPGSVNREAGYRGAIFGPTSLVINNECNGEDEGSPGGPGESRRIKAFKWFSKYFNFPMEDEKLLSCGGMPQRLESIKQKMSLQPDWSSTWKEQPCSCAPASYGGMIPFFEPGFYPERFVDQNKINMERCIESVYNNPSMYSLDPDSSKCLKHKL